MGWYVRDGVHERDCDFDRFGDQVLDFTEHGEVVLGLDVFWVCGIQASNEPAERCDSHTLADTEHGCIWSQCGARWTLVSALTSVDVGGTSLKSSVCVRNS